LAQQVVSPVEDEKKDKDKDKGRSQSDNKKRKRNQAVRRYNRKNERT
jgi:hypothetical protein